MIIGVHPNVKQPALDELTNLIEESILRNFTENKYLHQYISIMKIFYFARNMYNRYLT
jgi:hypothetical protein